MPIRLAKDFPARIALENEQIFALNYERASSQDIRPLKILIVNLMPDKLTTEIQLLRLLSNTPIQIDVDFLKMKHVSKNTSMSHLSKYYVSFEEVSNQKYDGVIITGAPLEHLDFKEVDYWDELCKIFKWSETNIFSSVYICWGAQAALKYYYDINKVFYDEKISGIYLQEKISDHFITSGFDDIFYTPQSRYTGVEEDKVYNHKELEVLSASSDTGINMIASKNHKHFFILGHLEYDADTLLKEYLRDLKKGVDIALPKNYVANDDIKKAPLHTWRSHANLFYRNWINFVYQETPYNLEDI